LLAVHAWIGWVALGPLLALWAVFQWQDVPWLRLIFGVMILPLFILVTLLAALIIRFGFHHPIALFPN
jgi:hypothetical protein